MSRKADRSLLYRIMSYEESILNERNWSRENFRPRNKSRVSSGGLTVQAVWMATSARWKLNSAVHDFDITKQTVESAESRARLQIKTSTSKQSRGNNRQYAQALHRQADELCQR